MVPHRKYCLLFYRMKSGKIHWNARRCSSQILECHSICPFDLHQLVEQCLIHYDDSTKCWIVFWPHAFTSTKSCSIIQTMCRCKYDKSNTNTCHVMWLVRVVLFKNCPASLIVIFTLSLKKKAIICTKNASNGSVLINIHELMALILLLISKSLLYEIPPTSKKPSCIACGTYTKDITCGTRMKT